MAAGAGAGGADTRSLAPVSSFRMRSPSRDPVALLDLELADLARGRRGDVHRRLVGLQRDQRIVDLDLGTGGDMDLDDLHALEVADVGDLDLDRLVDAGRASHSPRAPPSRASRVLVDPLLGRDGGGTLGLEREDHTPLRDLVAELDLELGHRARLRRGHVHGGLVALQGQERVVDRDLLPRADMDLDDRDVLEVTDVGDLDLDGHGISLRVRGSGAGAGQRTSRRTSSSTVQRCRAKRAASAPSITRWS